MLLFGCISNEANFSYSSALLLLLKNLDSIISKHHTNEKQQFLQLAILKFFIMSDHCAITFKKTGVEFQLKKA